MPGFALTFHTDSAFVGLRLNTCVMDFFSSQLTRKAILLDVVEVSPGYMLNCIHNGVSIPQKPAA
jgi:hypothetical protein